MTDFRFRRTSVFSTRHLYRLVFAITKRTLLPCDTTTITNNANNTSNSTKHDGYVLEERRRRDTSQIEGIDWMNYLPPTPTSFDSDVSDSDNEARTAIREEENVTDNSMSTDNEQEELSVELV